MRAKKVKQLAGRGVMKDAQYSKSLAGQRLSYPEGIGSRPVLVPVYKCFLTPGCGRHGYKQAKKAAKKMHP